MKGYSMKKCWIFGWSLSGLLSLGLATGCVSTRLQPAGGHPARADAPSAPVAEPATVFRADAPRYQAERESAASAENHAQEHRGATPEISALHQDHQHRQAFRETQTATVKVTSKGFEPGVLNLQIHIPARITFIREVERTCATEVVIDEYEIERELPLNEPVVVEFIPSRSGEFDFSCGMDMFGGKLVVTER